MLYISNKPTTFKLKQLSFTLNLLESYAVHNLKQNLFSKLFKIHIYCIL